MKLWQWVVCFGIVGLVAGVLLFPFVACACTRATPGRACLSQVKQMGIVHLMYAADHDDRLPHRDLWMDAILPYLKRDVIIVDPEVKGEARHGYAFHSGLSLKKIEPFKEPEKQPLVYDSINLGRNASDPFNSLPIPGRHEGKNSIVYLDGHAKRVAPTGEK